MRKKYFVELYFHKQENKDQNLDEIPNLDDYSSDTVMIHIVSTTWDEAKSKILNQYPHTAYIYVHETRNIDL